MATKGERFQKSMLAADPDFLKNGKSVARKLTIARVITREFDDGKEKPEIFFKETPKSLICNVTNWSTIAEVTGEENDANWAGHVVTMYAALVEWQGKMVWSIRVKQDEPTEVVEGFGETPSTFEETPSTGEVPF